ncbi:MAG: MFS transporter [Myxococcota bacterium]|nr:MFS transporter [Myxococcota bacterium]
MSVGQASRISLLTFGTPKIRAFHISWLSFFVCFFAWFGVAPLMAIIRDEFALTKSHIGNIIIASVTGTTIARLFMNWLSDKIGPRTAYTTFLCLGSLPVMAIGLSTDYESFLLFRLFIGFIGASFVITQYHTSSMFAPNVAETVNPIAAGWGNCGGGATQFIMPLIFSAFMGLGFGGAMSWRLAMVAAGFACLIVGLLYYFFTRDLPQGNTAQSRKLALQETPEAGKDSFLATLKDGRVWLLFFIYGACFGVELTIYNIATMYFMDNFGLSLTLAGLAASLFGLINFFARSLGGAIGDRFDKKGGIHARVLWLFIAVFCEGLALMIFSQMTVLSIAVPSLVVFSFFVQMSEGATHSVVPFIKEKSLGSVAGFIGAGGSFGAVCAGFLFKSEALTWPQALLILGAVVTAISFLTFGFRFSAHKECSIRKKQRELSLPAGPVPA